MILIVFLFSSFPESIPSNNSTDVRSSSFSKTDLPIPVIVALILIAILAVIAFVVLTFYLTRREVIVYNPEYGRVGTNGYVKGCSELSPSAQKGLDNGFTTVDTWKNYLQFCGLSLKILTQLSAGRKDTWKMDWKLSSVLKLVIVENP